jgi:hypothetical protein
LKERLNDRLQTRVDLDAVDNEDDNVEAPPRRRFRDSGEHAHRDERSDPSQNRGGRREIHGDRQTQGKKPLSHLQRVAAKAEEEQVSRDAFKFD